jgi:hypothetical protein
MASVETLLSESDIQKKRRRQLIISIIIGVIVLHVGAGVIAGIFVVAKYIFPPPANFVVKKDVRLPAKKREHKMNMATLDAAAPKPTISDRMQSTRPTAFSLPEMPQIPLDQAVPLDPSQLVADNVSSLAAADGIGTGGVGSAGSAGFGGSGMSFLGVQSTGKRILLIFDVSTSVTNKAAKAGVPLEKIQEETLNLISKLPITSRFGIIQFTQNYKAFNRELQPATDPNRAAATQWVKNEWVTGGTMSAASKSVTKNPNGLVGVLQLAAQMKPDVIYIISDGSFQWSPGGNQDTIPWDEIKKFTGGVLQEGQECAINFIAFEPKDDDIKELKRISARTGGKTVELKN